MLGIRHFSELNVLKCQPRFDREKGAQEIDAKTGKELWDVFVEEEEVHPEFKTRQSLVNRYKSLAQLKSGKHVVELRVVNISSKEQFGVNSFYTILGPLEPPTKTKQ